MLISFIFTFHFWKDKFKSTLNNTAWNWNGPPKNLIFQNILMKVLHWSPHGIGITICANLHLTVMGSTSKILSGFLRPYKIVFKSFLLLLFFNIFLICQKSVNWSASSMFNKTHSKQAVVQFKIQIFLPLVNLTAFGDLLRPNLSFFKYVILESCE